METALTPEEVRRLSPLRQPIPDKTWRAKGSATCGQKGYHGRTGVFEVWRLTEAYSQMILKHADELAIRQRLRDEGNVSLLENIMAKASRGETSLEEIESVGGFGFYATMEPHSRLVPATQRGTVSPCPLLALGSPM